MALMESLPLGRRQHLFVTPLRPGTQGPAGLHVDLPLRQLPLLLSRLLPALLREHRLLRPRHALPLREPSLLRTSASGWRRVKIIY